jgi:hypothetical protein
MRDRDIPHDIPQGRGAMTDACAACGMLRDVFPFPHGRAHARTRARIRETGATNIPQHAGHPATPSATGTWLVSEVEASGVELHLREPETPTEDGQPAIDRRCRRAPVCPLLHEPPELERGDIERPTPPHRLRPNASPTTPTTARDGRPCRGSNPAGKWTSGCACLSRQCSSARPAPADTI